MATTPSPRRDPENENAPTRDSANRSASDADARRGHVELEAYYIAERRGFGGDRALDDWLEAERRIDGRAAEAGVKHDASISGEALDGDLAALGKSAGRNEQDRQRIEPDQVKEWAAKLKVSAESLRNAIKEAGPFVDDVRQFLAKSGV